MNIFENFFIYNLYYCIINKLNYKSLKNLPKINKIVLTLKTSQYKTKDLALNFLIFKLLTRKSNTIKIIKTKKPNLILKIRKGLPIGSKLIITNQNKQFNFLSLLIFKILKNNKVKLHFKNVEKSLTFPIKNLFNLKYINIFYSIFMNKYLNFNINVVFNLKLKKEIFFIYKYL